MNCSKGKLVAALLLLACTNCAAAPPVACSSGVVTKVYIKLDSTRNGTLNGSDGLFAFFQVTNSSASEIVLVGWKKEGTLWMEYPKTSLQMYKRAWEDVVPLLGSFITSGPDQVVMKPGEKGQIAARADFGVPLDVTRVRLVIHLSDGRCLMSSEFPVHLPQ